MRQREELEFQILQLQLAVGVLNVLKRRRVVQSLGTVPGLANPRHLDPETRD